MGTCTSFLNFNIEVICADIEWAALMVAHIGYYIVRMAAGKTCISSILQGVV